MRQLSKAYYAFILSFLFMPTIAYPDTFGGDLLFLAQIVTNTLDQLHKMQVLIGKYDEEMKFLRDLNSGVKEVIEIKDTVNYSLKAGNFSDLGGVSRLAFMVEDLYGRIPKSSDEKRLKATDQTVVEGIQTHNETYKYADSVDKEADRIKSSARTANPQTAQRLTAQSMGAVIHVMNQLLRTNASMLKVHSQELALKNRREKLEAQNTVTQYSGVSQTLSHKPTYKLARW